MILQRGRRDVGPSSWIPSEIPMGPAFCRTRLRAGLAGQLLCAHHPSSSSLSSPRVGPMSKVFLRELTGEVRAGVGETRRCSVSSWGSLSPNTLIFPLLTSHPWGSLQPCKRQMASPHSPNGLWRQGSIFAVMGGGDKGWLLALRALQLPRAALWAWFSLGTSGHSHLPHERFFIFSP